MKHILLIIIIALGIVACEKNDQRNNIELNASIQGEWILANHSDDLSVDETFESKKILKFEQGVFTATSVTVSDTQISTGAYSIHDAESFIYGKEMSVIVFEPQGGIRTLIDIQHGKLILTEDIADGHIYVYEKIATADL